MLVFGETGCEFTVRNMLILIPRSLPSTAHARDKLEKMRLALLTDFGTVDPYVAVMKGAIASRTDAAIHDLTHDIPPFDVFGAAWFLATVAPWWPDTIFVCVVDPGVGTSRKIVAMERRLELGEEPENSAESTNALGGSVQSVARSTKSTPSQVTPHDRPLPPGEGRGEGLAIENPEMQSGRSQSTDHSTKSTPSQVTLHQVRTQIFLAPDNGLLTMIDGPWRAVSVENQALFLPNGSSTFHGRDRFAPVAAALANGMPLDELGPPLTQLVRLDYEPPSYRASSARGTIISVDRFGNCITDLEAARIAFPKFALYAGQHVITRMSRTYGDAGDGPFVITGSTGHLEISLANASAATSLGLRRGDPVRVAPASL
jgi:S-adenosylmethionine hydrolase